jgi:P-type Mg2+ transporter
MAARGRRVSVTAGVEPVPDLLQRLGASAEGLSSDEALERLRRIGPNVLRPRRERAAVLQLLARFQNPLILLLLVASGISALTGDLQSVGLLVGVVVVSVALDFVQEYRAGRAAEALRHSVSLRATAVRDGAETEIPARELVPGDVVLLSAGNLVPADCRLLEARDLFINEALLTGEPYPVEKGPAEAVLMGASLVSGMARAVVCETGARTTLGEIGRSVSAAEPPTAFEVGTRRFGLFILRLAILMVLFVILVCAVRQRPWLESFLFAVALAVGLAPELLPMIVSVTLARGALRMSAQKVIVKRLAAIHDLGSMSVLCTDKTGTLTEARIRLERHVDPAGRDSDRVLELAYLNSHFESGLKSPLDEAILRHEEVSVAGWTKIDEVPFGFERRRVSVLIERPGDGRVLIVKGALEDVLRLCTRYEADSPGDLRPLDGAARVELRERFDGLSREGFRVLGIAWKPVDRTCCHAVVGDEAELVFAGFAGFEDPPKDSAKLALDALARSGVAVKIVTGDNELVTQHVCAQLGIPVTGVLTGDAVRDLDDPALGARVGEVNLFCRVTPVQKNRVIHALKRRGYVVGYLGDGINDAPSLHSADVGISVDTAVDVAKEAADLILLERDLNVLYQGVREGRRTFGNIMKYLMMGTSSNFGNMFSMAGASLLLPFLPMLPVQVLLNNFLYDLSEIPIPMDEVDEEYVDRPRRWDVGFIRKFMLTLGPVSSVFDFLTFFVMLHVFRAGEALFHTGWFLESLATQILVIFVIRTRRSPFRSRPSALLAIASLGVVAVTLLLPYTGLGARVGLVPLPADFFLVLLGMVAVYLVAAEGAKRWFFRKFGLA